jgi:hypothetical protein
MRAHAALKCSMSADMGMPSSNLPCLDGRHDFAPEYFPQIGVVSCQYRCARCGWYLERILEDHPLHLMSHLIRAARKGDGSP